MTTRRSFSSTASVVTLIVALGAVSSASAALGPFRITAADSSYLQLQVTAQYQVKYANPAGDADHDDKLSILVRRIRPSFTLGIPHRHLVLKTQLSTAPGSLELIDLYADYSYRPNLQVRFGQFKVPFTRYRIQSFKDLTFVDWAIVTKYFGAERQQGLAVHNGYEKPPRYGYVAGVMAGTNARSSHAVGIAKFYGESTDNPSDLTGSANNQEFHPELFLHLSYRHPDLDLSTDSDPACQGLRYGAFLSAGYDLDPDPIQDMALRLAVEFLVKVRGWSVSAVGYLATTELGAEDNQKTAMSGGLAQVSYMISRKVELSGRYDLVAASDTLVAEARNRAVLLEEELDSVDQLQQLNLGMNVYLMDRAIKWQTDGGWLRTRSDAFRTTDFELRSQLQVSF